MRLVPLCVLALVLLQTMLLYGCAIEGAGFRNSGAYQAPACVKSRRGNVETWGNC
jgi:hypothetical protein